MQRSLAVAATLTAMLTAVPMGASAQSPPGCTVTEAAGSAGCSYISNGLPGGYAVAATAWRVSVGRHVIASSAAGSLPVGSFTAPKGTRVTLSLPAGGSGAIGS